MSAPRFTSAQRSAIVDAYVRGEPIMAIAARFACSASLPRKLAADRGLAARRLVGKRDRMTVETRQQVLAAYAAGEKVDAIAARFSCDPSWPGKLAKRLGLPVRPMARRPA